ncbi:MAG: ester cyclase [Actinomycetota bacterium]|nr:ester cyclase [Actinomycetota bacterium]
MPEEKPVEVVRRFWDRLIHEWALHEAGSLVTGDFTFRGALGVSSSGLGAFLDYAHGIRRALPDLRVSFDEVHEDGPTVAARLLFEGTHCGPLFGVPVTRRPVSYVGAGFFDVTPKGRLSRVWLVSDTYDLHRQLTAPVRAVRAVRPRAAVPDVAVAVAEVAPA